ncbi:MAG TPA: hypothetical protein VJH03_06810 [Blastocatellia bacterium]|nr:hypothetical protein [Blastocatellia bacterium]
MAEIDEREDIRIDEKRSTDGDSTSQAPKSGTRGRAVDHDSTSAIATAGSTRDPKRHRLAVDPDHASIDVVASTGDFEKPRPEALPLARARSATAQVDAGGQGKATLQRKPGISRTAIDRAAGQPRSMRKSAGSALVHSIPTVAFDDQVQSLAEAATSTAKPQRGSDGWLGSDRRPQGSQQSIRPLTTSVTSKDASSEVLADTFGAGDARQAVVVSPRIVTDRTSSERYATDPPSVRPAADPIASRREGNAVSGPTIRVTIGRIDVRAVSPPQPPAQETAPPAPRMSLDDYLRQQNGRPS